MTLKTHQMSQNTLVTILIWLKSHLCIWMLWFTLKTILIQPYHSEDHAERVFAVHALWTVMDFTPSLVSDKLIETLLSHHLLPHWDTCSFLRISSSIWPISTHNIKLSNLTWKEKNQKPKDKNNIINLSKIELNLMVFTNVSSVHAAQLHAHHIGGILKPILAHQSLCKPTDGLLTQEINIQKKDLKNSQKISNLTNAKISVCALSLVQRDWTHNLPFKNFLEWSRNSKKTRQKMKFCDFA